MGFGVLLFTVALATAPVDSTPRLLEQSYLASALSDARVRALLDEPRTEARADRIRDGALENPAVSFDREDLGGSRQETWALSWTPPLDGRHGLRARAGRERLAAAERRHEHSRVIARAELREAFASWSLAVEGAAFGARLATAVDRLARQAEAMAARGESSLLSARRLSLARVEVRAEAARLEASLALARGRVRAWLPELTPGIVPSRPPLPPAPADTMLGADSPQVTALEHEVQRAEALVRHARRFWPLPELYYGRQAVRGDAEDLDGPVYGARWGLPLFDRRNGDRTEHEGRLAAARARLELDRVRVREQVAAGLAAYATLRASAAAAEGAESDADRVLASAIAAYEAGESDVTDLLESLNGALSGRIAALNAYGEALRAHRELEVAAGRPLPLIEGDDR